MDSPSDLIVMPDDPARAGSAGRATLGGQSWRCALGSGGVRPDKTEGDGATPAGRFPLRRLLFRPDRLARPVCALPAGALTPSDGWCDDPVDAGYNRAVMLPYPASSERLWRDDGVYDLILVVGHNDTPPVAGAGSAIFIHCAQPDFAATAGCIAFAVGDLIEILAALTSTTAIEIRR